MSGVSGNDEMLKTTPVRVRFDDVECDDEFDDYGLDPDGRVTDVEAPKGKQLCLVALAVTNVAPKPVKWSSDLTATLLASDDKEYPLSDLRWSPGQAASEAGRQYSGDGDLMPPRATEYDYAMFELPDEVKPVTLRLLDEGS